MSELNIGDNYTTSTTYNEVRYNFILLMEESGNASLAPYVDSQGWITIGAGFNLSVANVRNTVLTALGISNANLSSYLSANYKLQPKDQVLNALSGYNLAFTNEDQVYTVFNTLAQTYESILNTWSNKWGIGIIPQSPERVALLSLAYNSPALLGEKLAQALNLSDPSLARAEAWYQIRYSHADQNWYRRYAEAALFGLYANPNNVTFADAIAVYQMFTQHRSEILQEEYPEAMNEANLLLQKDGFNRTGYWFR